MLHRWKIKTRSSFTDVMAWELGKCFEMKTLMMSLILYMGKVIMWTIKKQCKMMSGHVKVGNPICYTRSTALKIEVAKVWHMKAQIIIYFWDHRHELRNHFLILGISSLELSQGMLRNRSIIRRLIRKLSVRDDGIAFKSHYSLLDAQAMQPDVYVLQGGRDGSLVNYKTHFSS